MMVNDELADLAVGVRMLGLSRASSAVTALDNGDAERAVELSFEAYALNCEATTLLREAGA